MQKLFFIVLLFPFFSFASEIDCQDRQNITSAKCYLKADCNDTKDVEFGGGSLSNFETFTCERLITMYKASEKEGNLKERLTQLMKKLGLKSPSVADCPNQPEAEKEKCISNVYLLVNKFELDRYAFIDALKYKVAIYDSSFQIDGKKDLVGVGCDMAVKSKSPNDYPYNKEEYGNDCRLIRLNRPSCYLKPGTQPNYPAQMQKFLTDRNVCQKFIEENIKASPESFATLLQNEARQLSNKESFVQQKVDCTKLNIFSLKSLNIKASNVDGVLTCLMNSNASTQKNSSSSGVKHKQ